MRLNEINIKEHMPSEKSVKTYSIATRLTLSLMAMVMFVVLFPIGWSYLETDRQARHTLVAKADETINYLSKILVAPLWDFDNTVVQAIGTTLIQNDLVVQLRITDSTGKAVYAVTKKSDADVIVRTCTIEYQGYIVGNVTLAISTHAYQQSKRTLLRTILLITIFVLGALVVGTGGLMRLFLQRPLADLHAIIRAHAAGNYDEPDMLLPYQEFQPFGQVLACMGVKIESQFNELQAAEARYHSIFENAVEGILQATTDGRILHANPSLAAICGYESPKEFMQTISALDQQLCREPAQWTELLQKLEDTGIVSNFELHLFKKDGKPVWIALNARAIRNASGKFIALEGFLTDITARKQAAEALRKSEARYRGLFEHMTEGYAYCQMIFENGQAHDWIYLAVNTAFETLTGLKNVVGKKVTEVIPDIRETDQELFNLYARTALTKQHEKFEFFVKALNMWFSVSVYSPAKEYFISIFDVITARKEAEEQIHRLNAELEQRVRDRTAQLEAANKELEAFSYSVSHDLRTPLRHLSGFVELLNKRAPDMLDEKSKHYLQIISDAAQQMGHLIDDLLSFSRMGRIEMMRARVNLALLVKEVVTLAQRDTSQRDIVWRVKTLPEVRGDPTMLRIVFENLVANAVKFTRLNPQSEIEIGHYADHPDEEILYVKDNGAGFDMQYAEKLFGLFQRLHRSDEFEGTGLGLANIRRIIQRHGGRVWAEAAVNQGATFYVTLPKTC